MTTQPLRREFKVTSLPVSPQPNTIYYVKGPSDATARHYVTDTEGVAVEVRAEDAAALIAAHEAASDPHPGYVTTAEATALMSAHTAASDPHPGYLTSTEANAAYVRSVNGTGPDGSGNVTVSGGGGGAWGSITGTLSSQTDLQTALDAKLSTTSLPIYMTRAAVAAATIAASVTAIVVAGHTTAGKGAALYAKLGAAPSPVKAWHVQSADGAYWEIKTDSITPYMLGAVGDGVADDWSACQNALDYLASQTVSFPPGIFKITDTLTVNYTAYPNAVNIVGSGVSAKIDWRGGNSKPIIKINGTSGAGWYSKPKIDNLYLEGNGSYGPAGHTGTYTNVIGIQIGDTPEDVYSGVGNVTISRCLIRQVSVGIVGYYESDQVVITDNNIEWYAAYGIQNAHAGSNWWITHNHLYEGGTTSTGIVAALLSGCINHNGIQGTRYSIGIQLNGGANGAKAIPVMYNYLESGGATDYGIIAYGLKSATIQGNQFNGFPGATLIYLGDAAGSVGCDNIEVGWNSHTQSGGSIAALVTKSAASTKCRLTGPQVTDGGVTAISGTWDYRLYSDSGSMAMVMNGPLSSTYVDPVWTLYNTSLGHSTTPHYAILRGLGYQGQSRAEVKFMDQSQSDYEGGVDIDVRGGGDATGGLTNTVKFRKTAWLPGADNTQSIGSAALKMANVYTTLATLPGGAIIGTCTGTPEAAVTAVVGSLMLRLDGSTSTTLYVKTSGSGNTGWTAK